MARAPCSSVRHCRAITYTQGDLGLNQMAGEVQALVDKAVVPHSTPTADPPIARAINIVK